MTHVTITDSQATNVFHVLDTDGEGDPVPVCSRTTDRKTETIPLVEAVRRGHVAACGHCTRIIRSRETTPDPPKDLDVVETRNIDPDVRDAIKRIREQKGAE